MVWLALAGKLVRSIRRMTMKARPDVNSNNLRVLITPPVLF